LSALPCSLISLARAYFTMGSCTRASKRATPSCSSRPNVIVHPVQSDPFNPRGQARPGPARRPAAAPPTGHGKQRPPSSRREGAAISEKRAAAAAAAAAAAEVAAARAAAARRQVDAASQMQREARLLTVFQAGTAACAFARMRVCARVYVRAIVCCVCLLACV
jgi:hypothetical protein